MRFRGGWVLFTAATLGACVGDSSSPQDGGLDASTDHSQSDAIVDAPADVADAGTCDLTKPFGTPVPLSDAINSPANDFGVWFLPDTLTAFVWSARGGDAGGFGSIFSGTRAQVDAAFTQMTPAAALNAVLTGSGGGPVVLTADGKTVYFGNGPQGYYDAWIATRGTTSQSFGTPTLVPAPINQNDGGAGEDIPLWVTPDGTTLFFASNRTSSLGRDIWTSSLSGNGFGPPTQVSDLNSAEDEDELVLTPDQLQAFVGRPSGLYYSSRATVSAGFSTPTKLPGLSAGISWVTADGCSIYVQVKTDGGLLDIGVATRGK